MQIKYSRPDFLNFQGQRSLNNKQGAENAFKWFDKYLSSLGETEDSVLPKLREIKGQEEFYLFLNGFVQFMTSSIHAHSVQTYLSFTKSYLRKQGFKIYNEDVKQFIDMPRLMKESKVPLEKPQIKKLFDNATPYMKMVITWLVSSGMRISELNNLEKDDVDFSADPIEIHLRAEATKTKQDRLTFISHQAMDYKTKDIFKPKSLLAIEQQFSNLRDRSGLNNMYRTSRVHHITLHTFRSYFRTIAGMKSKDFAEDVLGHEGYLSQYIRLTMDDKRNYYREIEPKLTI